MVVVSSKCGKGDGRGSEGLHAIICLMNFLRTIDGSHRKRRPLATLSTVGAVTRSSDQSVQQRIDEADRQTRMRLPPIEHANPPRHLAPFIAEITTFIETQIQLLNREFQREPASQDEYLRRRRDIFRSGRRMFTDAFGTHRLFLDAIEDEFLQYDVFLEQQNRRLNDEIADLKRKVEGAEQSCRRREVEWDRERAALVAKTENLHSEMEEERRVHFEAIVRERSLAPDNQRVIQELQLKNAILSEENVSLKGEVDRLRRLTESLTLETFSDSLQAALEELRQNRETLIAREDQALDLFETVDALSKDIRRIADAWCRHTKRPLTLRDATLTKRGQALLGIAGNAIGDVEE